MSGFQKKFSDLRVLAHILKGFSFTNFAPMVRYLVLHLLAKLLHIRLEGNGQNENEEERRKMAMKSKKKVRVEENEARVEDTVGVAREGWKRGWEEEEKSLENWSTLNGLELGVRLSRLENLPRSRFKNPTAGWPRGWRQAWRCTRGTWRRWRPRRR